MLLTAAMLLTVTALLEGEVIVRASALRHFAKLSALLDVNGAIEGDTSCIPRGGIELSATSPLTDRDRPIRGYAAVAGVEPVTDSLAEKQCTEFVVLPIDPSTSNNCPGVETLAGDLSLLASRRTLEMAEVCELILERRAKALYCVVLVTYLMCTMWGYGTHPPLLSSSSDQAPFANYPLNYLT